MEKGEMEEIKRHFGVVAEGLRTEIRQVAEGRGAIREEIKRFSLLLLLSPPRRNDAIDALTQPTQSTQRRRTPWTQRRHRRNRVG